MKTLVLFGLICLLASRSPALSFGGAVYVGCATDHGGMVTSGSENVYVNGQRASYTGCMTYCPQVIPTFPPIPHVGGPIQGGSSTVYINGSQAAYAGLLALCIGPPAVLYGSTNVFIGP